jgi:hypothetical protein
MAGGIDLETGFGSSPFQRTQQYPQLNKTGPFTGRRLRYNPDHAFKNYGLARHSSALILP